MRLPGFLRYLLHAATDPKLHTVKLGGIITIRPIYGVWLAVLMVWMFVRAQLPILDWVLIAGILLFIIVKLVRLVGRLLGNVTTPDPVLAGTKPERIRFIKKYPPQKFTKRWWQFWKRAPKWEPRPAELMTAKSSEPPASPSP